MPKNAMYEERSPEHLQALLRLLDSNTRHLRDIKRQEMAWLQLFSILIGPAIAFLAGTSGSIHPTGVIGVELLYTVVTLWVQRVLYIERQSYYSVLRSVLRLEDYFGLLASGHVAAWMQNAVYPEGMGPPSHRLVDGTQRRATFTHRYVFTFFLLLALVLSAVYRSSQPWTAGLAGVALLGVTVAHCCLLWNRDVSDMQRRLREESSLAGAREDWISASGG